MFVDVEVIERQFFRVSYREKEMPRRRSVAKQSGLPEQETELLVPKQLYPALLALLGMAGLYVVGKKVYAKEDVPGDTLNVNELNQEVEALEQELAQQNNRLHVDTTKLAEITQESANLQQQAETLRTRLSSTIENKETIAAAVKTERQELADKTEKHRVQRAALEEQLKLLTNQISESESKLKELKAQLPTQKKKSGWF
jgi:SMC interacting uncharacterized protein involved in chromosome segregation